MSIPDSGYYYAFVGRVRGFTASFYSLETPMTRTEAIEHFHQYLRDLHASDYNPRDVVIDHILFSTDYIDYE